MTLQIVAAGANERGDLFGRLMSDLFHALGYDSCRFNVHKAGREIDVQADHRSETRQLRAECKATVDPIGGDDINKFVGALDAERRAAAPVPVVGYFISLSGFRETAIEQETALGSRNERAVLLDGHDIIDHLVRGRIVVTPVEAAAHASSATTVADLQVVPDCDLLGHTLGWIWVVYYRTGTSVSHACLVHADGALLDGDVARRVASERGAPLAGLHILNPTYVTAQADDAVEKYRAYVSREYGDITFEGMPTDEQVSARNLRLESVYVPMTLIPVGTAQLNADPTVRHDIVPPRAPVDAEREAPAIPVADALQRERHLAIVAAPGGGKTTLLKRLAVAYADPQRLHEVPDSLPDAPWLPIVLRCRQLEDIGRATILDLIKSLPTRAEMPELAEPFVRHVQSELRDGLVLLLVDGIDEIADPSDRLAFVSQLRTFLGTYPATRLVVTSREVGFRAVAATLDTICSRYKLADLSDEDIRTLTSHWYVEFVGTTDASKAAAERLARDIIDSDRVRRLACNPLLLTTLLLVHRWVGEVPRKRSVLYDKAIELLLMTWNVEGFRPIVPDEALPQLSFVAFEMMRENTQTISVTRLGELLTSARTEMPEVLGHARMPVGEFISRVEERSSLLSLSGHRVENGVLRPAYEFKHLTFQEYLAALAVVEGWYPGHTPRDTLVSPVRAHLRQDSWREVVPLVAVLGGRRAFQLVEAVAKKVAATRYTDSHSFARSSVEAGVLAQCLLDEVQIAPEHAAFAAQQLIRSDTLRTPTILALLSTRHGDEFRSEAFRGSAEISDTLPAYGSVVADISLRDFITATGKSSLLRRLRTALGEAEDDGARRNGLLAVMALAYNIGRDVGHFGERLPTSRAGLVPLVHEAVACTASPDATVRFAAYWAVAWFNHIRVSFGEAEADAVRLAATKDMIDPVHFHLRRQASWALWSLPSAPRRAPRAQRDAEVDQAILDLVSYSGWGSRDVQRAALTIAYARRSPFATRDLAREIARAARLGLQEDWASLLLPQLGSEGQVQLQSLRYRRHLDF